MNTIWKTEIPVQDHFEMAFPKYATILSVQTQYGKPCLWFICDPDNEPVVRSFRCVGTGHPFDNGGELKYIGTFQMMDGDFVGHLFEKV